MLSCASGSAGEDSSGQHREGAIEMNRAKLLNAALLTVVLATGAATLAWAPHRTETGLASVGNGTSVGGLAEVNCDGTSSPSRYTDNEGGGPASAARYADNEGGGPASAARYAELEGRAATARFA
jgi:hypothetical protein